MSMPVWINELQAFSVPAITVSAVAIAWQQYRVAKRKLKLDLYPRRYSVYSCIVDAIVVALNERVTDSADEIDSASISGLREARFLFDKKVFDYLNTIETDILSYRSSTETCHGSDFHQWSGAQSFLKERHEMASRLLESLTKLAEIMHGVLSIDDNLTLSLTKTPEMTPPRISTGS